MTDTDRTSPTAPDSAPEDLPKGRGEPGVRRPVRGPRRDR